MECEQLDILLFEYGKTQESAQHHDRLTWTVLGVGWGGTLALLGFFIQDARIALSGGGVVLGICGALLPVATLIAVCQFNEIKNRKYLRCKAIELRLGMRNHLRPSYNPSQTDSTFESDAKKLLSQRAMLLVLTVFMLIAWLAVLVPVMPKLPLWVWVGPAPLFAIWLWTWLAYSAFQDWRSLLGFKGRC